MLQERTNSNIYVAMEPLLGAVVVLADSEEAAKQAAQRWFQSQTGIKAARLVNVTVAKPTVITARKVFTTGQPKEGGG